MKAPQLKTDPLNANIWQLIYARSQQNPDKVAIRFNQETLTYQGLVDLVDIISARLTAAGVRIGDRVAGMVDKTPQGLALTFAVMRIGAVYVPVNPTFTGPEMDVLVKDAAPVLLVVQAMPEKETGVATLTLSDISAVDPSALVRGQALPIVPGADAPCAMLYTSGTTGTPKGARVSHRNMGTTFVAFNHMWGIVGTDKLLHVLPTYHAHGLLMATLCPLFAGAEIMLLPRFDIQRITALLPEATVLMAVPTIHARLEAHPDFTRNTCRNLRLVTSGSAPLSPDLFDRVFAKTGVRLTDRYGSTEAGMITANPVGQEKRGSVGKPLPGVDIRIMSPDQHMLPQGEIGRIQVRSPHVFLGYWNRPELDGQGLSQGGWFDTGDFGRFDEDGYLFIAGRDKDMIISGGFNVYPREIEIALEACADVAEAAVFGIPHPDFGEGVVAAVQPTAEGRAQQDDILKELSSRLASYKRPKRIFLVSELPKNGLGKILRSDLVEAYETTFLEMADTP